MYKYKNVSSQEQTVMGFGVVKPGQTIITQRKLENPNFEYLGDHAAEPKVTGEQQRPPEAVTDAKPVETAKEQGNERTA